MYTTTLRKIGSSIMLVIPPRLLTALHLRPGVKVGLVVQNGRLIMEAGRRPRYTLDELLAQCNRKASRRKEDRQWVADKPVGRELI
jgi:antitoxin ChpS